jgi:hypothetical protein
MTVVRISMLEKVSGCEILRLPPQPLRSGDDDAPDGAGNDKNIVIAR